MIKHAVRLKIRQPTQAALERRRPNRSVRAVRLKAPNFAWQ